MHTSCWAGLSLFAVVPVERGESRYRAGWCWWPARPGYLDSAAIVRRTEEAACTWVNGEPCWGDISWRTGDRDEWGSPQVRAKPKGLGPTLVLSAAFLGYTIKLVWGQARGSLECDTPAKTAQEQPNSRSGTGRIHCCATLRLWSACVGACSTQQQGWWQRLA